MEGMQRRTILSRLHRLGIKYGDINMHNFLIHDGRATLIDFDTATRDRKEEDLVAEFQSLREHLGRYSLGRRYTQAERPGMKKPMLSEFLKLA